MSDLSKLLAEISPEQRELLLLRLGKKKALTEDPSSNRIVHQDEGHRFYPLSYGQLRLWFVEQLNPGSPVYNVYFAFRLKGPLNLTALDQSFNKILSRHEILRATFTTVNDQPVQIIAPHISISVPVVDLSELPYHDREAQLTQRILAETRRPFDLSSGPLFRITLLKLEEQEHVLQVTVHHIVSDGWSLEILLGELSSWYKFFTTGGDPPNPLTLSYLDYVNWQKQKIESEILKDQLPYWRKQLGGAMPVMNLPTKGTRPTTQTFNGTNQEFLISPTLTQALKALSKREGITLYMTLLAAFQALLYRYTGHDDILVGSPTAGRSRIETEALIGMFVNTLVLRSDLSGDPTFRTMLARVREMALGAMAHQDLPFEKLVEDLQPERSLSHMPLFNVVFVFQKDMNRRFEMVGLNTTRLRIEGAAAKFDLTLYLTEGSDSLEGVLEYNTDLFTDDTITRMIGHFQTLLEGIVAQPDRRIGSLPLLDASEEQQLVVQWNQTQSEYPAESTIQELFEAQVLARPDALAVVSGESRLNYDELNRKANQLAHYLRRQRVERESLVGVCLDRSVQMVVALLGILKAGGAYVPLDPSYPDERLRLMLVDAAVKMLITQENLLERLPHEMPVISIDRLWNELDAESDVNPEPVTTGQHLAYVIYTSGSTGRPKGVELAHRGVMNLISWHQRYYDVSASDRATQLASQAFDASVWEFWPYLTAGASVYIVDDDTRATPQKLLAWLSEHKITLSFLPTPLAEAVLHERLPKDLSLRALLTGGDRLHRGEWNNLPFKLVNHYGPTESTVVATCGVVNEEDRRPPTIGRPIANTEVYILDSQLQVVPVGIVGELYIGGASLARGYLKRPELTAEKFVPHPFNVAPEARLYKTGDLARYLANGEIEFVGRIDQQVKVRGFRIELGEIESVISEYAGVREVVVNVWGENEDRRLVAYVVKEAGAEQGINAPELRDYLKKQLPEYMIPTAFVIMDQLPLTSNGKVDYRALPAPDQAAHVTETVFVPARSPVEEMLSGIWAEILGLERVGVHDNFFDLGGHSLLGTQVISRVRKTFDLELPLRVVFEGPTVAEMAERIEQVQVDDAYMPALVRREPGDEVPLSFAQQRLWFLDQLEPGSYLFNVPIAIQLSGELNVQALRQTLATIVERHEILRTNYVSKAGQPNQVIKAKATPELTFVDLRSSLEEHREQELQRYLLEDARRPFSLSDDLLLRATLFQLSGSENVLLLTTHHIAADGWSMGILFQEIAALYKAFSSGESSPLSNLPIQYGDYAIWQRRWLHGEALENELSYWRRQLKGAPAVLELLTDRPRPAVRSFQGSHHSISLPESITLDVKKLSRQEGVTLFMVLLAAFQILLSRHAGHDDIVVGTDVANRTRLETEGLIGFFVNLLVLRTDLSGNPTFREVLRRVREVSLGAYAHQQMPFEKLVEELQPERTINRNPLVQVLFVLQNAPSQELQLPGLTARSLPINTGTSKFDFGLFVREAEQKLIGTWVYNTGLFDVRSVVNMARQYETLLGNLLAQPNSPLSTIQMVDEAEKEQRDTEKRERHLSRRKSLLSARRKVVDLSSIRGVKTDYLTENEKFPLVVQPELDDVDLPDWAKNNRDFIDRELLKHGAILFRNFNLVSPTEFEQVAQTICPNLFGEYGDLPREGVEGKIYASTPYPSDETILFHNESSHMHRWPMKIWFFCVKAAEQGGETPIVDCRRVYELMDPALRERFEEKKLMYVRNYTEGLDVNWQTFFHTTDRSVVEDYCRKASIEFEWGNGSLRTRQICAAVVKHPQTGETVFFNQLQLHHVSCLQPAVRESLLSMVREENLPRNVYYGDGSPIEDSVVQEIRELYFNISVSFQWRAGDILMLNNMLTAHARNPYVGPRKIVVAMGEMMTQADLSGKTH